MRYGFAVRLALSLAAVVVTVLPLTLSAAQTEPPERGGSSSGGLVEDIPLEQVAAEAEHVLIGRVAAVEARISNGRIESKVDVIVDEYLKSSTFHPVLSVIVPGGTVGDVTELVEDVPVLTVGQRVVLFINGGEPDPGRLTQGGHGVYLLEGDLARLQLLNRSIPLTELKTRVQSTLSIPLPAYNGALIVARSLEQLTASSDEIVVGRVESLTTRRNPAFGNRIETVVTLIVDQPIKGSPASRITLNLPGGEIGSVKEMVGGVPNFLPRERVLLLLTTSPTLQINGQWQGKYTLVDGEAVQSETGQRMALSSVQQRISAAMSQSAHIPESSAGEQVIAPEFTTFCAPWTTSQAPIPHLVNPSNSGSGAPSGSAFIRLMYNSLNSWQALSGSWISLQIAGTTSRVYPGFEDGLNDIGWGNLDNFSTGTLGINFCTTTGATRTDSDTYFDNTGRTWSVSAQAGTFDLRSVAEHEFGHGIGIGHSDQPCDGSASTPLMCAAISSGVRKVILSDDANAAAALYSVSGGAPSAPSGLSASAGSSSVSLSWNDPNSSELAFEVQRATGGCGGSFTAVGTTTRNTASFTDSDYGAGLSNGTYCYRVKSLGQGGDSGFSGTASATIGSPPPAQCSPRPNVARSLSLNGSDQVQVSLSAGSGDFQSLTVTRLRNASIRVNGSSVHEGNSISLSGNSASLLIDSTGSGAFTAEITVSDGCGSYPLFFGYGT